MDERQRTQFTLLPAQRALVAEVRAMARENLVGIAKTGTPARVNRDLVRALGRPELLGRLFPDGGRGASALELCLLREALSQESTEAETALALQGLGAYPIWQSGRLPIVERWIPEVAAGNAVAAFALTEPDAGSDVAALATRAIATKGGYVLTGTKSFISNAPDADIYTLFARTTEGSGARGITAFAVPAGSTGLSGSSLELVAAHPVGRLELEEVFVPADHVLGRAGAGFKVAMGTLDLFRPSVGAFAVGMAQAALDSAVVRAKSRRAFGRSIGDFQAVSHALAEMATRLEAARLLVYAAAAAYDSGEREPKVSAMAKMHATETAQWVVDRAVQIHGAQGLEKGHLLEHLYREVRAPRIYEGTTEIQREIIARELLG